MGRSYDPWAHALELQLHIKEADLPGTRRGEYWHSERLILLRRGLSQRAARCTLAHEIQHALAGDEPIDSIWLHRKAETRASRRAAWALIDPFEYAEADLLYEGQHALIAHELNVTSKVLTDWRQALRLLAA